MKTNSGLVTYLCPQSEPIKQNKLIKFVITFHYMMVTHLWFLWEKMSGQLILINGPHAGNYYNTKISKWPRELISSLIISSLNMSFPFSKWRGSTSEPSYHDYQTHVGEESLFFVKVIPIYPNWFLISQTTYANFVGGPKFTFVIHNF